MESQVDLPFSWVPTARTRTSRFPSWGTGKHGCARFRGETEGTGTMSQARADTLSQKAVNDRRTVLKSKLHPHSLDGGMGEMLESLFKKSAN